MTFGSLFAGIGGFDLGLERAGMECKWQVEIDDFCSRVLEKHWPHVKRYRDVREVGAHNLEPVDLICGGFPCQPFSVAGKQRGKEDDRHLWPEMFRIVSELRPTWVVGENVPGLVRLGLDQVLSDLEGIGYSCQTFDIPACAVDAPHVRHRIWIVANAKRGGCGTDGKCGSVEGVRGGRTHDSMPTAESGTRTGYVGDTGKPSENANAEEDDNGGSLSVGESGSDVARTAKPNKYPWDGLGTPHWLGKDVADAECPKRGPHNETRRYIGEGENSERETPSGFRECGEDVAHADKAGLPEFQGSRKDAECPGNGTAHGCSRWLPEPELGRVAHGIPRRVDRLRSLGNAVVPQVVEIIGRAIMTASNPLTHREIG